MKKRSDETECSKEVLEIIDKNMEDPECGPLMEIVDHIREEEAKVRGGLKVERLLACRIDQLANGNFKHKYCPSDWVKKGKKFDYFLLIGVKEKRDICVHVECKRIRREKVEAIKNKFKGKKDGYLHSNECFCFSRAIPKTAAVIILEGSCGVRKSEIIKEEIKKIKFDYCIVRAVR